MIDSPPRVAAQRWHHWVPGAAVAVMAAAATLLPELAVAQDVYLRAGIDLSRPVLPLSSVGEESLSPNHPDTSSRF